MTVALIFWISVAATVYTYAGYPLALWVLARFRRHRGEYPETRPTVTLLIAAHNEEDVISAKLEESLALDYPGLQIIVAADGSNDRTADLVREFSHRGVELSFDPVRRGKMAAINRAMPRATGEIVLFSDANNSYLPTTVREITKPFADPTVGAVSGRKAVWDGDGPLGYSENLYWRYESFIKKSESRFGSCLGVSGEVLAVRRALFRPAPTEVINDDTYMAVRVLRDGYRVVYQPSAVSIERVSATATDEMKRRTRMAAGHLQLFSRLRHVLPLRRPVVLWQLFSHKLMRPLLPIWMVAALAANVAAALLPPEPGGGALLRLAYPFNWHFLALQAGFYALAFAGDRVGGKLGRVAYVPAFLLSSNLAALRAFRRLLTGKESAVWERVARSGGLP